VRFTEQDGILSASRTSPGRGAYTCRRRACFEQALERRAFARALRCSIVVEPGLERLYTDS
jgi:predicted RNA-binding protein YlxR (DUF448 family)